MQVILIVLELETVLKGIHAVVKKWQAAFVDKKSLYFAECIARVCLETEVGSMMQC